MKTQTFTNNNTTVTFPAGYATIQDYAITLKLNLKALQLAKKPNKKLIANYQDEINLVAKALT